MVLLVPWRLRSSVGGVRVGAEKQWDMVMLLFLTSANLKDDLDIWVEVAGNADRGPIVSCLEGHAVDAWDKLVRWIQECANASIRVGQALSETTPGVVGSRVELLQLDRNVLARLASGRVKHMAGDGTPSHGEFESWGKWNGEGEEREIAFAKSHIQKNPNELPAFLDRFLSPTPRTHPHCVPSNSYQDQTNAVTVIMTDP